MYNIISVNLIKEENRILGIKISQNTVFIATARICIRSIKIQIHSAK